MNKEFLDKWTKVGNEHSLAAHGDNAYHPECDACVKIRVDVVNELITLKIKQLLKGAN
jgi:hypothetical protein